MLLSVTSLQAHSISPQTLNVIGGCAEVGGYDLTVNGITVGRGGGNVVSNTAYSISGTSLTYDSTKNGTYTISVGDRIQFDFSY